jgi:hypothetical protein
MAGVGLGIFGSADTADAAGVRRIEGAPLHGDTLANHLFLVSSATNRPVLGGSVALTATVQQASARLKFADVFVVNGSGAAALGVTVNLKDPQPSTAGRITLPELLDGLADIATLTEDPVATGTAELHLPVQATLLGNPISGTPAISVSWRRFKTSPRTWRRSKGFPSLRIRCRWSTAASASCWDWASALLSSSPPFRRTRHRRSTHSRRWRKRRWRPRSACRRRRAAMAPWSRSPWIKRRANMPSRSS